MAAATDEGVTHDRAGPLGDALSLLDVAKSFGPTRALDGFSLVVGQGQTVALLGPNGAGKTTALSILLGLVACDQGAVHLLGGPPAEAVAGGHVGAVLQDGGLMPGVRVGELLRMLAGLYPAPLPVERVIRTAQLEGLQARRVDRLSVGEAQRVRVAAALVGSPDLLVLDEPTVAMDVQARQHFWFTMRSQAAEGRTILFSTHYLEEADDFADRVVVISRGRVLADGSPGAIKAQVGGKTVSFCAPGATRAQFRSLPGVLAATEQRGRVELRSADPDATLRALLSQWPDAYDIDMVGAGLEEAFLALTEETGQ